MTSYNHRRPNQHLLRALKITRITEHQGRWNSDPHTPEAPLHCIIGSLCLCFKKGGEKAGLDVTCGPGGVSGLVTFEGNGEGDDSPDYHGQGKWRPLVASSGGWLGTAPSFQANSFSQDCCVITSEVLGDIRLRESSAGAQWSVTRSYSNTSMPHQ